MAFILSYDPGTGVSLPSSYWNIGSLGVNYADGVAEIQMRGYLSATARQANAVPFEVRVVRVAGEKFQEHFAAKTSLYENAYLAAKAASAFFAEASDG